MDIHPELVVSTSALSHPRERIRLGGPSHTGEANEIAEQILREYGPLSLDLQANVLNALMQIVIAKQLNEETHEARAAALALVDSIPLACVHPSSPASFPDTVPPRR